MPNFTLQIPAQKIKIQIPEISQALTQRLANLQFNAQIEEFLRPLFDNWMSQYIPDQILDFIPKTRIFSYLLTHGCFQHESACRPFLARANLKNIHPPETEYFKFEFLPQKSDIPKSNLQMAKLKFKITLKPHPSNT